MKKNNYIILLLTVFLFTGCYTEEDVTVDVKGVLSSDAFYTDEDMCEQVVNAIYDPLGPENSYSKAYWAVGDVASDDTEEGGELNCSDPANLRVFHRWTMNSNNTLLSSFISYLYQGVSRANTLLDLTTKETINEDFSLAKFEQFTGEAYFLRAFYYFDLVKVYGPVPFYTKPVDFSEYKDLSNRTGNDDEKGTEQKRLIMKQVISDLKAATERLPNKADTEEGRAHKQGAYALLAKAQVYYIGYFGADDVASYVEAEAYADTAISLSGGIDGCLSQKYFDIFTVNGENGDESLFEIQFIPTSDYYGEGTIRNIYQGPRYIYKRSVVTGKDSISSTGNKVLNNTYVYFGLNVPRKELYESFDDNGTEHDPRRDMISGPGDTIFLKPVGADPEGWYTIATELSQTGYFSRKTEHKYELWGGEPKNSGLNYMIYRMADLVLLNAECAFHNGNTSKALQYVNAVRKRARESKVTGWDANRDPIYGVSSIPANLSSIELTDIYKERRLELFCEGHRYYDLVRQNRAVEVLSKVLVDGCGVSCNFDSYNSVMPIPLTLVQAHQGNVEQNPGY